MGNVCSSNENILIAVTTNAKKLYWYNQENNKKELIIETGIEDSNMRSLLIIKVDSNGNYLDSILINGIIESGQYFELISNSTLNGSFAVGVNYTSSELNIDGKYMADNKDLIINRSAFTSSAIFFINNDMQIEWNFAIKSTSNNYISKVQISEENEILLYGKFMASFTIPAEDTVENQEIELNNKGNYDLMAIKFNLDGKVKNVMTLGGTAEEYSMGLTYAEDNSYIVTGYSRSNITIPANNTLKNEEISITKKSATIGYAIKFTSDNKVEWVSALDWYKGVYNVIQYQEGYAIDVSKYTGQNNIISAELTVEGKDIILDSNMNSAYIVFNTEGKIIRAINVDKSIGSFSLISVGENIYSTSGSYYGNIYKAYQKIVLPEVPKVQNIMVNNYKKQYYIVTSVIGNGGTISGQNQSPYEEVTIHEDSKKEIIAVPNVGYAISSITINGKEISYIPREDGTVILDKFINMSEDKYIIVTFLPEEEFFTISKKDEKGKRLPGAEFEITSPITDNPSIGENSIGELKTDSWEQYGFIKDGDKYIPQNLNKVNSEACSFIPLDLSNGNDFYKITINVEVSIDRNYFSAYVVSTDNSSSQDFDINNNTDGPQNYSLLVKGGKDYEINLYYANYEEANDYFAINSIKVEQCEYKQTVTTDSNGEIKLTLPNDNYVIKEIKAPEGYVLNDQEIPFTVGGESNSLDIVNKEASKVIVHHYKDGTTDEKLADDELFTGNIGNNYTTAPKDIEGYEVVAEKIPTNASGKYTEEVQEIIYYYKQTPVKLIVHHYLEGTEEIVPGSEDDQINEERERNSEYKTSPAEGLDAKYELVSTPSNANGTLTENETVVTYYYRVKDSAGVIVHHIDTDTKEKIAPDVVIPANGTGKYGDEYTTEVSEEIPENYEYVSKTDNWEGTMIDKLTEVTYEYKLVDSTLTNTIEKTATEKIDNIKDEITYNITYTANVVDYIGKAQITAVDTLPYAIDVSKSTLNGGTYDANTNTITWKEIVEGIDTYANPESGKIEINKTIKVVYTNIDAKQNAIENTVKGQIKTYTPEKTSEEVTDTAETTTGFIVNVPVSKVWDDDNNKAGKRPESVIFKLTGSDGSEYTKELTVPGTEGSTTTKDSDNENKWNDIFENLPRFNAQGNRITYTLTEEEKTEGDLQYYDTVIDTANNTITNTSKYGKVTVLYYIQNPDGTLTTNKVPDINNNEIQDVIIEGKEGDEYSTEPAENVSDKYELVEEKLPENSTGTIEKYDESKPQEVIYYYRLKPAKVIVNYLEKDGDSDDSNNQVLSEPEQIDGHIDDKYNTDTDHRKETISYNGKTYTLVENSKNTEGRMTVEDIKVTYYYLQNTKATVRYVERDPISHETIRDLEEPRTEEGLVGDEFVTTEKAFTGYRLVKAPENKTIEMTKEEQTLIYYYEPITTGLVENHIDDITGKVLYTETHNVQVGQNYNIPSKEFAGYDLVETKLPNNSTGIMGEELVTVNYYYIKNAVLEVNYIDKGAGEPLADQIVDETKHEGDSYTTVEKTFEGYELIEEPENANGTMEVEVDADGNIVNNRTVVTYYYGKPAEIEEHHVDILTKEEIEEPTIHKGYVGEEYNIPSKEFLSYVVAVDDGQGNNMLPTNSTGKYTEEKQVVTYYYYQPAKVIVHYVDMTTGKEIEETNEETGKLQSSQVVIEGTKDLAYTTTEKEFQYYTLVQRTEQEEGTMKVEITKDENGKDIVNNTIDVYYYYEPKSFNIGVDKTISKITVNGEEQNISNNKLTRVEIYRKNVNDTKVEVEYTIKVTNNEEVDGKAIIRENIPDGMSVIDNDETWEEKEGYLSKVIPEIKAGETKKYKITLAWNGGDKNLGEKNNKVEITQTDNIPGFKDNNNQDNSSEARVLINVSTGSIPWPLVIGLLALVGLEGVTLSYARILTNKQKKNRKR